MQGRTGVSGIGWVAVLALAAAMARGDTDGDFVRHRDAGRRAYQKRDYATAVAKLKEARKAKADPGLLIEIGLAYLDWKGHAVAALQVCSQFYKEGGPAGLKQHADECVAEASRALDAQQTEPQEQRQDGGRRPPKDHKPARTDPRPAVATPAPAQPVASGAAPTQPRADEVAIPKGTFRMGSEDGDSDEKPVHEVKLAGFYLDRTEVTVAAYGECVKAGKCKAYSTVQWEGGSDTDVKKWSQFCNWGKADRDNHPINCVDWEQATAYCSWKGKRLPTEAEWEYAARGTDGRKYPWGSTPEPGPTLLNACGSECVAMLKEKLGNTYKAMYEGNDGWPETAPVGSFHKGAGPFGAEDMAGNVWEWTSSKYCTYPNVQCAESRRVARGGSWFVLQPAWVRAADRNGYPPTLRYVSMGFRCARTVIE